MASLMEVKASKQDAGVAAPRHSRCIYLQHRALTLQDKGPQICICHL